MQQPKYFPGATSPWLVLLTFISVAQWVVLPQATFAQGNEAWRKSMSAFAAEVLAVGAKSKFINASEEIKHVRDVVVLQNAKGENISAMFQQGLENEFHGALNKHFSGLVAWHGLVASAETDKKGMTQVIEIRFPVPANAPKGIGFRDAVRLEIPVAKLPSDKLPTKGSDFAFTGQLKKNNVDSMFNPVWVLYGIGPDAGKATVGVLLTGVEPGQELQEPVERVLTNDKDQKITAMLLSADDSTVNIRKDGNEFVIQLSTLSQADRDFIKGWRATPQAQTLLVK